MKQQESESVVQDWVSDLPFMMQALLLTGIRGADGVHRENSSQPIIKFIRGAILKPDKEIFGNEDHFMWIRWSDFEEYATWFLKDLDSFTVHFLLRLIHVSEVIGYKHPDRFVRSQFLFLYVKACHSFNMSPESVYQLDDRFGISTEEETFPH